MSKRNTRGLVVIERGGNAASGLLWLLVGGAVGAGLGLLFAPHTGKKTRELLSERLSSLKESAEAAFDELSEEGEALAEGGDDEAEADEPDTDEAVAEAVEPAPVDGGPRRATPSARAELEHRLARARARRHRELAEEDEEPVA